MKVPFLLISAALFSVPAPAAAGVSFSREIRPILSDNCISCHGPDEKGRKADLRLDDEMSAKSERDGVIAIVPGKPEASALIERIESKDPDEVMPPPKAHKTVSPQQIALLKQWIKEGAAWGKHWAYEPVQRPAVPTNGEANPIDAFLAARLAKEKLSFSPAADAATITRRLALDITGLPPTLDELARLERATPQDAVAHFLAKPAYGEHWAWQWLDLARYADSAGYPSDPGREIWAYRDWVIRALNANMPYDRFTIEQLAGDLLPNPTSEQLIATAFHRNTMTQNEGGTSDEEFRVAAVIDRVNTTFAVWMGTTMACAQCHTHKYDPITNKEYFQFYAFLNQSADADRRDESPLHSFDTPETLERRKKLQDEIASLEKKFSAPPEEWLKGFAAWEKEHAQELAWQTPKPEIRGAPDATIQEDGRVTFTENKDTATYTLDLPISAERVTALRLETAPQPGFGNFVVSRMRAEVVPTETKPAPQARFVRVELPAKNRLLQLAEVEVFKGTENVAPRGTATQSSTYAGAVASRANDGKTDGNYDKGSVAHTGDTNEAAWWEVDLKTATPVDRVVVWNRTDAGTGSRLEGFNIVLLDEQRQTLWKSPATAAPAKEHTFTITGPVPVTFSTALADYEQSGFEASKFLDPKSKGWAVAGAADRPHTLTLLTKTPVAVAASSRLRVTIEQKSESKKHTLGNFRIGFTDDARVQRVAQIPAKVLAALTRPSRTAEQQKTVIDYYVRNVAKESASDRNQLATAQKNLAAVKPVTVPIMRDLEEAQRRVTKIQLRGNWQNLGEEVTAGTPSVFPPLPDGEPRNRLTMAKWLVSRANPLTARVTVNRLWESVFGVGIVRSSEEFGSQGDMPLHPELLDWLAAEFVESGWDVKHLLTLMFTSRAYRQVSTSNAALNERDPDNRLLARGPRFRPTGEQLRDQALAVSGLLSAKLFGPPVRPMRPNLGLNTAFGGGNDWTTSAGEDRHRRSVYTEVKRNSPYPSFTTFDAPNREVCTIRRGRSNTPLQAFVTLNDPVFVEAHQALARRLLAEAGPTDEERIRLAFRLCVAREPSPQDIAALGKVLERALALYRSDAALATKMATEPLGPAPKEADVPTLAAWTTVASIVMNLDEFLMRR